MRNILILLALFLTIATIRVLGPTDIYQGDQPKQADYVMDIVVNHNFWLQHHEGSIVASKPPLYNWLAAPLLALYPGPNDFLLKFPSLLAAFFVLLFLYKSINLLSDEITAFWGTIFLLTTGMFAKQIYFARTDMLLLLWIMGQVYCMLLIAERNSNKCILFSLWLMGGLGILTKGPIAVVFPHLIISSWTLWEGNWKNLYRQLGWNWGWILLLAPTLFWLAGIFRTEGLTGIEHIYRRMIVTETFERLNPASEPAETRNFFYYTWHFIARTLPWSILGIIAFKFIPWKSFRSVNKQDRVAILGLCWVVSILLFLSIFPSKRIVRVLPAVPGICILAGYALKLNWDYLKKWPIKKIIWLAVVALIIGIFLDKFYLGSPARSDAQLTKKLVLKAKSVANRNHANIFALKGSPYPLRYFLFDPTSERSLDAIHAILRHNPPRDLWVVGTDADLKELTKSLPPYSYTLHTFENEKKGWKKVPHSAIKIHL